MKEYIVTIQHAHRDENGVTAGSQQGVILAEVTSYGSIVITKEMIADFEKAAKDAN